LTTLNYEPDLIVGHSAGAAIALRLVLDGHAHPKTIVSLNGALRPFPGMAGHIFPTIARALFLNPLTPAFMAWSGSKRANVEKLLNDTGSKLTSEGIDYYARLFRSSAHVAGALGMMAHWDLQPLVDDLPKLKAPLVLFAGMKDKTIDPSVADDVAARVMSTQVVRLQCLGHLAHEEQPDLIASKIYDLHKKTKSDHTTLINS
ncbi:MAG: alpha/beta fold hydrolase BchO, partial [Pseudomonadota bacterium]